MLVISSVEFYPEPYQPDKDIPVMAILVSMIIDDTGQNDLCRGNHGDHRLHAFVIFEAT
jgi:hypothetical protein